MRERLAQYTGADGKTRLVGGSSDTIYIPGRHAEAFRETLAIFLETTCFLEIATPTTVHLVAPLTEPILFVDHVGFFVILKPISRTLTCVCGQYWIWDPPLNATFVRNKWAEGLEVWVPFCQSGRLRRLKCVFALR
jgi:hypothetical protein